MSLTVPKDKKTKKKTQGCGFISAEVLATRKEEKEQKEANGKTLRFNQDDKDLLKYYFQGKGLIGKIDFKKFLASADYRKEIQAMEPHWMLLTNKNWSQTCQHLATEWQANAV